MTNPAFELSIDVRLLSEALLKVPVGNTISYSDLGKVLNSKVEGGTPALQSAIRRVMKNDGAVFENVRGVGYQRLSDTDIVSASERDVRGIRRKARRAATKLTKVANFAAMPQDKRIEHNTRLSILSAVGEQTSRGSEKRIAAAVERSGHELPFAATLDAFKKTPAA